LATGSRAEAFAARHLEEQGFRIVARNWRRPEGEIDIVADDRGTCVFVEVRSRTGRNWGHPLESVTPKKRARIIRSARLFLDGESTSSWGWAGAFRFDVVGVIFSADGQVEECLHVRDAFQTE
jgi:putative endonuclease